MTDNRVLSTIFWQNKIKDKEIAIFPGEKSSFLKTEIVKENIESFLRIAKDNSLSKFTIISSIFSLLTKRYFENFQNIIKVYPSDFISLDMPLLLEFENSGTKTFKEILQSAAGEIKEAFAHKNYDGKELDLTLFSNFSIQFGQRTDDGKQDHISLLYEEDDDKIIFTLTYHKNYPEYLIESFLGNFTNILCGYESILNTSICEYSLVHKEECERILIDFNKTATVYPEDKTIVTLFEEQVKRSPESIAVVFENSQLSYEELNVKANQLAHHIKNKYAVESGKTIAVLLPKSMDLLISLLSIEKLGCIYLPIDVNYPKDRIDYIFEDSNAAILISTAHIIQELDSQRPYISLDSTEVQGEITDNLATSIQPTDIAYLIYTSGSTGKPKGVLVEHHSTINMSLDQIRTFEITSNDRIVWFASVAFDASISEIMMSLYSGSTLLIPTEEEQKNKEKFVSFLEKTKATVVTFPPSYLELFSITDLKTLRTVITAGESAHPAKAKEIVENGVNYYNAYGPTEYSVCTSIFKLEPHHSYTTLPIGRPISNTRIYILDEDLNVVPIGINGQLYISGCGLSRGYLNKAELTAEKFIANPFEPGFKMYDTGDLARWLPDGNIEFLGRKDFQVKIRGYRIELGELETTISQFNTSIQQVVADAKEVNGEKVLVAYYTIDKEAIIDKTGLRNYLQSKLPEYMIPGFFVELDKIPLTPNGKIDRQLLPDVTGKDLIRKRYVAPRNEMEHELATIWQDVLNVDRVGITDSFFELGGHSLMVAQVLNRIYQGQQMHISFKDFFAFPTIEGITNHLTKKEYTQIPQAGEQERYPLTPSQQRLWVLSQLEGGSQAYNMPAVVTLKGKLNDLYFEKAFQYLIGRHEILRTSFQSDHDTGEIHQYIHPLSSIDFQLERLDFRGKTVVDVDSYLHDANSEPFDLESGPLLRGSLLQLDDDESLFFLSMHHIIGDGWSTELLISEVVGSYNNLVEGNSFETLSDAHQPLSLQYKDYAVWLQDEMKGSKYQKAESYWLKQFEGDLPILELPGYKPRPLVQTYQGDNISHLFSQRFTEELKRYSEQQGATLFMTLMAGVKALLYRYSGQKDIIVGTPIAGREHPDLENQIGLYLNTLAIRTRLEEEPASFESLLSKEKDLLLSAYEHQVYPFDELVGKLNLKRNTSRSALFDVLVTFQNQSQLYLGNKTRDIHGLEVLEYHYERKTSQFDISYTFTEESGQLGLSIEYNTDIYDRFFIEKMFYHFENLFLAVIENTNGTLFIEDIEILTGEEREELLNTFNPVSIEPEDQTIVEIFESQVEKYPNRIAVVFESTELTYQELNEQANQLGAYLRDHYAICANDFIGIKLERSEKMLVAILGILKSGAAYIPIDPEYPQDRIDYIESDSQVKITLDEEFFINFDEGKENYSRENSPVVCHPEDLAYVIYTSGTTGQPKGVMIEHRSVVSIYNCWKKEYELEKIDIRLLQLASISFDVFVGDICRSILNGGQMIICPNTIKLDVESLYELLKKHQISILEGTPSLLLGLCNEILTKGLDYSFLKIFIFGSDSFNNQDYLSIKQKFGRNIKVINSYGVTEATIDSTFFMDSLPDFKGTTPIGKPFSNTKIYIGNNGVLSPVGVYNKLYISGCGLSRGYLNKAELTAEKFIANPFEPGFKMYDTGDLARWLPDGNIEFLGRKDFQVKIRGYRIELGELETTISQFNTSIQQVVADAKEVNGEKVLVAYYTIDKEAIIDKTGLRNYLQSKLPEYMIPGFFVELDKIPLTPNGKIDRQLLPDVTGKDLIRKRYVAPRNEMEHELATIWQDVLNVDRVGITDSFFELGGHSLMVAQVLNRIYQGQQMHISFKDFFAFPTIEGITNHLTKKEYTQIPQAGEQERYPLTPSQQRLWVLSQLEGGSQAYNMPAVVTLKGKLNDLYFEKAFQYLIGRHEILRTSFQSDHDTGEIHQYIHPLSSIDFQLERLDFRGKTVVDVDSYLHDANSEPFDLESGPLLRGSLLQLDDDESLFFLSMHHIIGDGWSTELLISEVVGSYNNLVEGNSFETLSDAHQPLSLQYKDYAVWLQDEMKGSKYQKAESYWLKQFEGDLPILELPGYKPRPLVQTYQGDNISHLFSQRFTEELKRYSEQQGATLFMTLMAGVKALLYRYSGQKDIIVGTPIAGREHPDLENQIGLYLNTLAIRTRLEEEPASFESLLSKEKDLLLSAYEHQVYPFDELVGKLNLKRNTSRSALFDVLVTFQNQSQLYLGNKTRDIHGLEVLEYHYERKTSQFDISYTFTEESGQLGLSIEYNTDIYDRFFIEKMFYHFENLFLAVIENTNSTLFIEDIDFLTNEERTDLVFNFNSTATNYPKNFTVVDLFCAQVEKTPNHIAVQNSNTSLTYKVMDKKSDEVAFYLLSNFGEAKEPVGVLANRSPELLVLLLGILKAGKSYIPIDPFLPGERISYIIRHSHASVIISEKVFLEDLNKSDLSEILKENIVQFVEKEEIFQSVFTETSEQSKYPHPSDTAYIIYTSGSTGTPKGVEIGHESLTNFLTGIQHIPGISVGDVFYSVTTYSFDISILEFFTPLISGASVFMAEKEILNNVEALQDNLAQIRPGIIQGTPSFYQMLFNSGWKGDKNLKVLCGGDRLSESLAGHLLDCCGEVWNMYGPTETTIWSSIKKIEKSSDASNIGSPIQNTQMYILDSYENLLPVNTAGRIFISGDGLAKGYYNNESLSDEKFIDNPFSGISGSKMYETGDLGKWTVGGEIEFLGRNDFQVKLRGFRIELGEIETRLQSYPGINQVVCDAKDVKGEKVLAAYYTCEASYDALDKGLLREYLQGSLPEYMIPGFFVELHAIPLTSNGKIDRKALPDVTGEDLIRREYVAPVTELEVQLAMIWQEVLGVERIGITDNFFELGGHSLAAIKLIHTINARFGVNITLNQFFEFNTIEYINSLVSNLTLIQNLSTNNNYEDTESEIFTI